MRGTTLGLMVALIVAFGYPANAATIEINAVSVDGGTTGSGPGYHRGISFLANSPFSITSVGLWSDIGSTSYNINIFSSTDGHQTTGLLSSTTATVGGSGLQWYDVAIGFPFAAGSYYAIGWETTSGAAIPGGTGQYFHYGIDSNLPFTTGPVTLIDGFAQASDFGNSLHPRLRVNTADVIPEPATLLLLGAGLGAVVTRRRLTKRA